MIYLSGHSSVSLRRLADRPDLGVLLQPGTYGAAEPAYFHSWAADNGCFAKGDDFDAEAWLAWLEPLPRLRCLFAVAPDVVGDHVATWERSAPYLPRLRDMGFRAAFVAQDGLQYPEWSTFDCLFMGGTTEFKLSEQAYRLAAEAKGRGKWVHMGRVNSWNRLKAAAYAGYDSVDGTFLAFGPDTNTPRLFRWLDRLESAPFLLPSPIPLSGEAGQ